MKKKQKNFFFHEQPGFIRNYRMGALVSTVHICKAISLRECLVQWFPNFFLSRRILEKNRNHLAHFEHLKKNLFDFAIFLYPYVKSRQ